MCGRFTLQASGEELASQFELPEPFDLAPRYNIAPTQDVAVVLADERGQRRIASQRWGLIPFWAKDARIGSKMINARAETVAEKPAFRDSLASRRCIVPADGFYEWGKSQGLRGPHWIHPTRERLMGFAGLWAHWKAPEGVVVESCAVVTTDANATVGRLHDRMPVVLARDDYGAWLDPGVSQSESLLPLLRPCPNDWLEATPVGPFVNDVRIDDARCLEPPAQQSLF